MPRALCRNSDTCAARGSQRRWRRCAVVEVALDEVLELFVVLELVVRVGVDLVLDVPFDDLSIG